MREYNILTPGDKIRNIRDKFDFKQEELAGEDITRNLISIVENNKASLTETTAKILSNNINKLCKERGIDYSVTEEYLLESVTSQAKKIADEYIESIDKIDSVKTLDEFSYEIDVFLKTYPTEEKKSHLYFDIGWKYKDFNQHTKAINYFIKTYEVSLEKELTVKTLLILTSCHILSSNYEEAINHIKTLMDLDTTTLTQFRAKYNLALCYKKLSRLSESVDILEAMLDEYTNIFDQNIENMISVKMLLGSCYAESNCFNRAIKTYKDLLNITNNPKHIVCILLNLADVYRYTKDITKLKSTCDKVLKKINSNINLFEYEAYIYLSLSKNLRFLDSSSDVGVNLLYKALDKYKEKKCSLYIDDVETLISDLLNTLIDANNHSKIVELKNTMFELIENDLFPKTSKSALLFIRYYNLNGFVDDITGMIDYLAV